LRLYINQRPADEHALHILSLLSEREGRYEAASSTLHSVSEFLEQRYEESEDADILHQFCIVKSDLGRILLGLGDYAAAVDNASVALDLSEGEGSLRAVRLSSYLVRGLGYFFQGDMEAAIPTFQEVLRESDEDIDVMLLVAQALWATGGSKEREIALQQIQDWFLHLSLRLTFSVVKDPTHLGSLCALASIGLSQNEQRDLATIHVRLRELSVSSRHTAEVHTLLTAISRGEGRKSEEVFCSGIMLDPSLSSNWLYLSKAVDAVGQLALKLAANSRDTSIKGLAFAYETRGSFESVQAGINLSPWWVQGWRKLTVTIG
jgi:superkiller protein 3